GGVCLNVGCIPSKALLHAAKVIEDAQEMESAGIKFGQLKIDAAKLLDWKNKIVARLTGGLATMARQRKVEGIRGYGRSVLVHEGVVDGAGAAGARRGVAFAGCIIAGGSESARVPGSPDDPRMIGSAGAPELVLPKRLLVAGGGSIAREM